MNNSPQIQSGTGFTLRPLSVSYCHSINIRKTGKTRLPDFQLHSGFAKVFRHCGAEALGVRTLELFKGGGCPPYPVSLRPPHLPSQVCAKHSTKRATDKGKLASLVRYAHPCLCLFTLCFSCSHLRWLAGVGKKSHRTHRGGGGRTVYIS